MRGQPRISGIYQRANQPAPIGVEAEERNTAARASVWNKLGLVVIDPEDVNSEWLRQALINEAEARYGRRGRASG